MSTDDNNKVRLVLTNEQAEWLEDAVCTIRRASRDALDDKWWMRLLFGRPRIWVSQNKAIVEQQYQWAMDIEQKLAVERQINNYKAME